jgi:enamine deaminase RidA (YjgF/YER057c/UK114 family)
MVEKENSSTETASQESPEENKGVPASRLTPNVVILSLIVVIIIMAGFLFNAGEEGTPVATANANEMAVAAMPVTTMPSNTQAMPATTSTMTAPVVSMPHEDAGIERKNEGRLFYRTIKIPPGAETLYVSGSGAAQKPDGTWGNMEEQAIDIFTRFRETLEEEDWSMADIVQVRVFAVAGDYGLLDFDGFNRGYSRFFGTQENPNKPVRSFVQVADLVVDGWLVEVEIRAARMPD